MVETLSGSDYTIYLEDCIEGMKKINDCSIDLIIADPPFGIGFSGIKGNYNRDSDNVVAGYNEIDPAEYHQFTLNWLVQAIRVLKEHGTMYVFSSWNRMFDVYRAATELGLYHRRQLTWSRTFPAYKRWCWVDAFYQIFMFLKYEAPETGKHSHTFNKIETPNPKTGKLRHYARSDLRFPEIYLRGKKKIGTKLPNALVEHLILTSSKERDIVFDPFLGNGTTAVEALKTNRQVIAFEINPNAWEIIETAINEVIA